MEPNVPVKLLFIIEGATEKGLQFIMPLKSVFEKNFCFNQQKFWKHCGKLKTVNRS